MNGQAKEFRGYTLSHGQSVLVLTHTRCSANVQFWDTAPYQTEIPLSDVIDEAMTHEQQCTVGSPA